MRNCAVFRRAWRTSDFRRATAEIRSSAFRMLSPVPGGAGRRRRTACQPPKLISFRRLPKLIGIPASPGVAIGKVHAIDRRRARVPRFHIAPERIPAELERLDHAVRDSVEQLRAIRESLGEGEQGDILDAHRLMADDPAILEGARTLVREELLNAEWAVRRTFREVSEKLGNDGYLAERRAGVEEGGDRVLHHPVRQQPNQA